MREGERERGRERREREGESRVATLYQDSRNTEQLARACELLTGFSFSNGQRLRHWAEGVSARSCWSGLGRGGWQGLHPPPLLTRATQRAYAGCK